MKAELLAGTLVFLGSRTAELKSRLVRSDIEVVSSIRERVGTFSRKREMCEIVSAAVKSS